MGDTSKEVKEGKKSDSQESRQRKSDEKLVLLLGGDGYSDL